ncbi:hypothetical protein ACFTWN_26225 [Streptomyces sp. NPDC057092]|uniref:hypothetical protein n=1 Tax=Streptomyces sp. NPDC057092 TaxID=3346017 RepID=UPI0036413ACF
MTDEATVVQQPALAALSAIVHSQSRRAAAILEAVARGLVSFEPDVTKSWFEVVEVGLESTPARENWRKLMQNVVTHFPGHGTLFEEKYLEGKSEGKAEGKSEAILRALKVRGLTVPDDVRERITGCTDLDTLATWFDRSLTVSEAEGLFAGEAEEPTAS